MLLQVLKFSVSSLKLLPFYNIVESSLSRGAVNLKVFLTWYVTFNIIVGVTGGVSSDDEMMELIF